MLTARQFPQNPKHEEEMVMAASQDTEITLGTGKMLGIFFGLVILCGVFFGIGFSVGKSSLLLQTTDGTVTPSPNPRTPKKGSAAPVIDAPRQAPDMTFYKSVGQSDAGSQLSPVAKSGDSPNKDEPDTNASAGYFVQVAAVSKQDDAEALVGALKKKQYAAVASQTPGDKLFHVQIGPFTVLKDAENMRTQLLGAGYNPILKK
jgi:DedD protein